MINARKFESFCIDPTERWMFAGNVSGQIAVIDIDRFAIVNEVQAHAGVIHAMAAHPRLPYVAALSSDGCVSIWRFDGKGGLWPLCIALTRDVIPSNDTVYIPYVESMSQPLAFHDAERRLVTRSGNGGLLELAFDDAGGVRVLSCVRLHRDYDTLTARYVKDSDLVLSGSRDGEVVLSHQGTVLRSWQFGDAGVHWAEHIAGATYLLADDRRFVVRLDISNEHDPVVGPVFTRDDLEHVTYNHTSGRAFVAGFDRNVYEIDPETCRPLGVVFPAPFKLRWVKTLEHAPSVMLVQCRNGGLYKVDVETGQCLAVIKETPDALWTAVATPEGEILIAGEGEFLLRIRVQSRDPISRSPIFRVERQPLDIRPGSYTKRMVRQPSTGYLILGRTNGDLIVGKGTEFPCLANMGSAVRDVAVHPDKPEIFIACEDGHAYALDLESGKVLHAFLSPRELTLPIWCLAYNPERDLLAFAERGGSLWVVSARDFRPVLELPDCYRPKRMKWVDADILLLNQTDKLYRLDLRAGERSLLVEDVGNTIEDFIWDARQQYLVLIYYNCGIVLCDFWTGMKLSVVPDQMDYSKGLIWVDTGGDPSLYPWDFLTFGRSGQAHHFRIHDQKVLALGPVGSSLTGGAR